MSNGLGFVAGRVVDAAGAPVARALVAVASSAQPVDDKGARTNDNGEFSLGRFPPGEYTLEAHSAGLPPGRARVVVASDQRAEIEIRLDGSPDAGAVVGGAVPTGGSPTVSAVLREAVSPGGTPGAPAVLGEVAFPGDTRAAPPVLGRVIRPGGGPGTGGSPGEELLLDDGSDTGSLLEVTLVPDRIDWSEVRLARVSLTYPRPDQNGAGDGDAEEEGSASADIFFSLASHPRTTWKVAMRNQDPSYAYTIVYFLLNSLQKTVIVDSATDRELVLDPQVKLRSG